MIIDGLIGITLSLIAFIVGLFPSTTSLPTGIDNALTTFSGYLHNATALFPVSDLMIAVGVVITVETAIWGVVGVIFVYNKIRGA